MGIFKAFKKTKKEIIRNNQHQGKAGEDKIRRDLEFSGYKVERTGRGHDFKAKRRNWLTGKNEIKYIETKTGNSPLSKLQKKRKRQMGSKYVVKRLESTPLGFVPASDKKHKSARSSKFDALFGSSKPSKKKSSTYAALFGSKTTKGKKRSVDSLFGSSPSGKRKKSSSTHGSIWGTTSTKSRRSRSTSNAIWGSKSSRRSKKSSIW